MTKITPRSHDVLFGRGYAISAHQGNQVLRSLVRAHKPIFHKKKKMEKRDIGRKIVNDIQFKMGGMFLIEDANDHSSGERIRNDKEGIYEKSWVVVPTEKAVDKVMHRLREKDLKDSTDDEIKAQAEIDNQLMLQIDSLPFQASASASQPQINDLQRMAADLAASDQGVASPGLMANSSQPNSLLQMQQPTGSSLSMDLIQGVNLQMGFNAAAARAGGIDLTALVSSNLSGNDSQLNQQQSFGGVSVDSLSRPMQQIHNKGWSPGLHPSVQNLDPGLVPQINSSLPCNQDLLDSGRATWQSNVIHPPLELGFPQDSSQCVATSPELGFQSAQTEVPNYSSRDFFILETTSHIESFPISVKEFVRLGYLSNPIVLDQDNTGYLSQPQTMENAARFALVLAQVFHESIHNMDAPSIQLDDFYINLQDAKKTLKMANEWIPLRLDIVSPTQACDQMNQKVLAMQNLGKLLYAIFSLGEDPPPHLFAKPTVPPQGETSLRCSENEGVMERPSKSSRHVDESVFSRLVEDTSFPTSVCRLLSDMIDVGPGGTADSPFQCFEEVIQDLEQMVSQPRIFLLGSCLPPFDPQSSLFGHRHHGRKVEVDALKGIVDRVEQSLQANMAPASSGVEAVFVSGIAGSGKSCLVQSVEEMLNSRWIVIKSKFEQGKEHISRRILSSMFDGLIVNLVEMRDSGSSSDVVYSQQVSESILVSAGYDRLSSLIDFLPSLALLYDGISAKEWANVQAEDGEWRLIFSLSKILEAVLGSGRCIMMCCDDLQWADKSALSLLSEVLVNIGSLEHVSSRCLLVGSFRHDEIDDDHPFSVQYSYLQIMSKNVNTTEIKITGLSKKDVVDVIAEEFHLPHRIVQDLADVTYKKTSGHAMFVVEFLNTLLRNSIITYSSRKQRYSWDADTIGFIQTEETVAELIASNIKSLPLQSQEILRIISCFGIQTDVSLLQYLDSSEKGIIESSLEQFIEYGILDRAGPMIMFTHDLIQEATYTSMPMAERQNMHLKIGQCLGEVADVNKSATIDTVAAGLDHIQIDDRDFYGGKNMMSSLISIACDQIDRAIDSVALDDESKRIKFARWNLMSACKEHRQSNCAYALYQFSKGIAFLGQDCWRKSCFNLCHELHKGAVKASFALGQPDNVAMFGEEITSNVRFEDSLEIQPLILRSLSTSGKHDESISMGISIASRLNFNIPPTPTQESILKAVTRTDQLASTFSEDQLVSLCGKVVDPAVHQVVKVMDAFYASCFTASSPMLPLVACAIIDHSLEHGVCREATVAFATLAMLKILFVGDYSSAKYWADVVRAMDKKHNNTQTHSFIVLNLAIDIFFTHAREISRALLSYHDNAMKSGHIDIGMLSIGLSCRNLLLGGENLSLVKQMYDNKIKLVVKHSQFIAQLMALDSILLAELTGEDINYFSIFNGKKDIRGIDDLQDVAKSKKDMLLLQSCRVFSVFIEYWRGNFMKAEEHSHQASITFLSKEPNIYNLYHTFFRGLLLFRLFRQDDGDDHRLEEGKKMMNELEKWAQNSMVVFENKWRLLMAEHASCIKRHDEALILYEAAIRTSQDHGNIHELALSHELLGEFYIEHGHLSEAIESLKNAHMYYIQWGASAVARKLLHRHKKLGIDIQDVVESTAGSKKRSR